MRHTLLTLLLLVTKIRLNKSVELDFLPLRLRPKCVFMKILSETVVYQRFIRVISDLSTTPSCNTQVSLFSLDTHDVEMKQRCGTIIGPINPTPRLILHCVYILLEDARINSWNCEFCNFALTTGVKITF